MKAPSIFPRSQGAFSTPIKFLGSYSYVANWSTQSLLRLY